MLSFTLVLALTPVVLGQFPPAPKGVTTLKSKYHEGVKISYKEVCSTNFAPLRILIDIAFSLVFVKRLRELRVTAAMFTFLLVYFQT
jgi:hypothetical protein